MWPTFLLLVYCLLTMVASLMGGWLPLVMRLTHMRMQLVMSFVGGLMMGVALLHLLPHAVVATGSLDYAAYSAVLGLLAMFFTIRMFHVHGHEPHEHVLHEEQAQQDDGDSSAEHSDGERACAHSHGMRSRPQEAATCVHELSGIGVFIGMGLHTVIDGVALAASVAVGVGDEPSFGLIGFGTFLAVVLHKPLDSVAIAAVMLGGGWSPRWRGIINAVFALMCPIGALVFYFGIQSMGGASQLAVGCALAFAAGAFLCISLADVLPEVQFHRHDRLKLSAALLLGVALAWAIGLFEPEHAHSHDPPHAAHQHAEDQRAESHPGHGDAREIHEDGREASEEEHESHADGHEHGSE